MKAFKIIFLPGNKLVLSKKPYASEDDIKADFPDSLISMDFDTIDDVEQYLRITYRLDNDSSKAKVDTLESSGSDSIELDV